MFLVIYKVHKKCREAEYKKNKNGNGNCKAGVNINFNVYCV